MFNNKEILGAITTEFNQELSKILDKDKRVIEANAHIESMIKFDLVNTTELQEHYTDIIAESNEISYFKGLQEGAKMIYALISGTCVHEVMRTWGVYTEEKYMAEININSHYSNIKNGFKNGVKIDG